MVFSSSSKGSGMLVVDPGATGRGTAEADRVGRATATAVATAVPMNERRSMRLSEKASSGMMTGGANGDRAADSMTWRAEPSNAPAGSVRLRWTNCDLPECNLPARTILSDVDLARLTAASRMEGPWDF